MSPRQPLCCIDADCASFLRSLGGELVLLHGSQSMNRARPESDTDVAVCIRGSPPTIDEQSDVFLKLSKIINGDIDVTIITTASDPLLAYEVFHKGRIIWQADNEAFGWWGSLILRRYADTRWLRGREREAVQRFFARRHIAGAS